MFGGGGGTGEGADEWERGSVPRSPHQQQQLLPWCGLNGVNTKVHACTNCNLLQFVVQVQVHCHEPHTVCVEVDEGGARYE